jgi:hypothetical protein
MRLLVGLLLGIVPVTVFAQDFVPIDQSKPYVTDQAACDGIAEGDIGEAMLLTFPKGIETYEYYCDFYDIKQSEGSPMLFVDAICEEPGARNPDVLSISPYEENSIEVVSLYESFRSPAGEDNPNPGTTIFYRCD